MPAIEHASFAGPLGTLRGLVHRPDHAQPAPGIVLLHGLTGQHIESDRLFVQLARALSAAGFAALRFDFYGSGDSDGDFEDMTIDSEVADAVAALSWFSAQPGIDAARIGILGLSLGGAISALLAGHDPRVKAAVLWNALAQGVPLAHRLSAGPLGGLTVGAPLLDSLRRADPVGAIARYPGPALIIHATDDTVVPVAHGEAYAAALGSRGTLRLFEGGDHVFAHPDWRATVFDWTIGWLARVLCQPG